MLKNFTNEVDMMNKIIIRIISILSHYLPALVFTAIYSSIPAIPFVRIDSGAYIFVGLLFLAGILLTFKLFIGAIVGILACAFAVIKSYLYGNIDMRMLITCSVLCIYYIYFFIIYLTVVQNRLKKVR